MGIAAAVAVNVLTTSTVAEIENGLTVTAGGCAHGRHHQPEQRPGPGRRACDENQDSIGAAVSLNIANVTNTATIGLGDTISAAGVSVTALMPSDAGE